MDENGRAVFKLVKYSYVALLVLGLLGSVIFFIAGVVIWADKSYSYDSSTFDRLYDSDDSRVNDNYGESDRIDVTDKTVDLNDREFKRNLIGAVLTFGGLLSATFYLTGMVGALKENLMITRVIFILSIIGTISQLIKVRFNVLSFVVQLLFLALIFSFMRLIKKKRIGRQQNFVPYPTDVEGNAKTASNVLYSPYAYPEERPPSYEEHDKAKILA